MKYTTGIIIDEHREKVAGLLENMDHMYQWQEGLESHCTISGKRGEEGCRTELVYHSRRGLLVMTETVVRRQLPAEYHTVCRANGVINECFNYFHEEPGNRTRWEMVNIYRFRGLMRLMAPWMKSAFVKTTQLNMERFKIFAEKKQ